MNKILRSYRLPEDVVEGLEAIPIGRMTDHVVLALREYLARQDQPRILKPQKKRDDTDYSDADDLIDLLNSVSGRRFRHTKQNREGIHARLQEYSIDDCKMVIRCMWSRWGGDEKMEQHFNPITLFRPANFEKYLNTGFKPAPKRKLSLMERQREQAQQNSRESLVSNGGAFQLPLD